MTTERQEKPPLATSPSFDGAAVEENELADAGSASAVPCNSPARHSGSPEAADKHAVVADDDDDDSSEDFEFAVRGPDAFHSVAADEIFAGGRILPAYPVFNPDLPLTPSASDEPTAAEEDIADQIPLRGLLMEGTETRVESSSEKPAEAREYGAWAPDRCKKSASTGSSLRWRIRDMMVGRSHSDGKEKFVFLEAAPPPAKKNIPNSNPKAATGGKGAKKVGRTSEADVVTAHRPYCGKGTGEQAVKGPRRSFLPYRQDLLGLFAPANGLRRSRHPF